MLAQLRPWLENLTPEMRTALREGGLVLAALLCGQVVGSMLTRMLRARNFDALLRLPGSATIVRDAGHGFTPTMVGGMLIRLTVWGAAGAWLAHQHGYVELAGTMKLIINRTWALAAVLVVTLWLGNLLAGAVIDCLKAGQEAAGTRNGSASGRGVAGAVGAGVYCLVVLFALLTAADFFDWPLTRDSALALWQFVQHGLLPAGAALLVGYLGAGWARELATLDGTTSPEKRAGQYTALGIVAATTMLAVAILLSSASLFFGLVTLTILGLAFWLLRGHLPDIAAGLQLRAHQVHEVWFDGAPWQLSEVGLITTQVSRGGQFSRVQNRLVLEARMHGKPAPSEPPQAARPVAEAAACRVEARRAR
jgi:hypothetical protein